MQFPTTFTEYFGNASAVLDLRAAIASGRLPHSLILTGPAGVGKYTLALLLTLALECDEQPRAPAADGRTLAGFCGHCRQCTRILESADLAARIAEAAAAREELRETDKKETRVLVQTHPDVLIVPPDPPQLLIKLGQIRTVIGRSQYVPTEAPARVFIITAAAFMKEAANSLLKLLEEPPDKVHLILLAENMSDLLPTIRSRCAVTVLRPLAPEELEALLAVQRPQLGERDRALLARLSEGAPGRALGFDLPAYTAARQDALVVLSELDNTRDHAPLFRMAEAYRAGVEGQAKMEALLQALARLLEDVLLLQNGAVTQLRNVDLRPELERLADGLSLATIESAVRALDATRAGMRRNLLRSLSLEAMALSLGSPSGR